VNVLCPDGHRITVKINRQTPLLTILEDACSKRKLDPAKHGLRKENDRPHLPNLDTSLTVNFAGLPNHCKLEVVPCENQTSASQKVKIALQLEQGGRVIGEYSSEDTLDKIYEKAKEKMEGNIPENSVPVIIYVRQELVGIESFSETSLKKLGLTGGSAVLRLIHRAEDNLNVDQAGVYNMVETEVVKAKSQEKEWRPMRKEGDEASLKLFGYEEFKKEEKVSEIPKETREETMEIDSTPDLVKVKTELKKVKTELKTEEPKIDNVDLVEKVIEKELPKEDAILHYLDEDHQTVIYKLSDRSAKIRNIIDVSDDFFELTIEDAKSILRDARKAQKEADPEAGGKTLMTKAMRETQKEGKKLALLNKYKRAVVRVQLPDRYVIQAVFPPGADLIEVMENCKRYLNIQENLELFTTPPKTVLDLNQNLLDCDLVPAALIYLASKNSSSNISISNEVLEKLSNANGAENALSEAGVLKKTDFTDLKSETQHIVPSQSVSGSNSNSSGSASALASNAATKRPPTTNLSSGKVPKWLKSSKQ